jgi:F-type H+-transporting ATPase subunit alpha
MAVCIIQVASGFLPAIDVTRSVSRVGGKAQPAPIRTEAGRMKLDYLQFLELEVFTRFGATLESSMQKKIERGRVLRQILKQDRLSPLPIECQMAWMMAFNEGLLDALPLEKVAPALEGLFRHVTTSGLSLSAPREQWLAALSAWKQEGGTA